MLSNIIENRIKKLNLVLEIEKIAQSESRNFINVLTEILELYKAYEQSQKAEQEKRHADDIASLGEYFGA